jgi:hypothetical protein
MAAPNLALALPVPQAHEACTFAQLYDDASKDPFKRNYERIMERFDPDRNDAVRDDVCDKTLLFPRLRPCLGES